MKTQWRAVPREELECSGQRIIEDEKGDEVAYVGFDEDAEFIATACNAHAGLVEALKELVNGLRYLGMKDDAPSMVRALKALAAAGVK